MLREFQDEIERLKAQLANMNQGGMNDLSGGNNLANNDNILN